MTVYVQLAGASVRAKVCGLKMLPGAEKRKSKNQGGGEDRRIRRWKKGPGLYGECRQAVGVVWCVVCVHVRECVSAGLVANHASQGMQNR